MLHLIWYIIVGLIAGWAAKSLMISSRRDNRFDPRRAAGAVALAQIQAPHSRRITDCVAAAMLAKS